MIIVGNKADVWGVCPTMRICRFGLPTIGLLLFLGVTLDSVRMNREAFHTPSRYFYWSSFRLDSDPLNRQSWATASCNDASGGCTGWDPMTIWVEPGWLLERW
jgi:hypothetical protein